MMSSCYNVNDLAFYQGMSLEDDLARGFSVLTSEELEMTDCGEYIRPLFCIPELMKKTPVTKVQEAHFQQESVDKKDCPLTTNTEARVITSPHNMGSSMDFTTTECETNFINQNMVNLDLDNNSSNCSSGYNIPECMVETIPLSDAISMLCGKKQNDFIINRTMEVSEPSNQFQYGMGVEESLPVESCNEFNQEQQVEKSNSDILKDALTLSDLNLCSEVETTDLETLSNCPLQVDPNREKLKLQTDGQPRKKKRGNDFDNTRHVYKKKKNTSRQPPIAIPAANSGSLTDLLGIGSNSAFLHNSIPGIPSVGSDHYIQQYKPRQYNQYKPTHYTSQQHQYNTVVVNNPVLNPPIMLTQPVVQAQYVPQVFQTAPHLPVILAPTPNSPIPVFGAPSFQSPKKPSFNYYTEIPPALARKPRKPRKYDLSKFQDASSSDLVVTAVKNACRRLDMDSCLNVPDRSGAGQLSFHLKST